MRNLKILTLLLAVILLGCISPAAQALDDPTVNSGAALLMETDSRSIIYAKEENARVYPASTTKIMTVLLAVEAVEAGEVSLSDVVTADAEMTTDLIPDGSSVGLQVGETMTLEDLLYCAMLSSGNDACNVIARHVAGSIPAFVDMMNERAAQLGCVGTHFANTHGLPNENHYTTAWDFAQIALEAISHSEFMTICDTVKYEVPATNMFEKRTLINSNGLINNSSLLYPGYEYEYAHGVKTGYTSAAGYCLVSTAEKEGIQLLCVVMGGVVEDSGGAVTYSNFTDSRRLYDWGFENFSFRNLLDVNDVVTTVDVAMGADGDKVSLKPQNALTAYLPNDTTDDSFELSIKTSVGEDGGALPAPIAAGDVLGEVTVSKDDVNYGTVKLVAASSVELSKMSYLKNTVGDFFGLLWVKVAAGVLLLLLVLYIVSVVMYRRQRRRYIRAMRARQAAERRRREQELQAAAQTMEQFEREPVHAAPPEQRREQRAVDRDYFDEFFKK
ncbi:MAG: D-alanyl-D-alanine carboxypeptidase family protein [Candidatus Heteroscillospira sp.]|jgi:D-alanyl-D-alanine carboxypeptidase (penicillin-binding protein 5/6)